ncbi:MAG: RlpA-like double-psi beta-barrel-protein domain-containing protein-containing protein [Benjaminiella poitrasii]|nr:MAG: RlpA-like double-psi beta-barrel-protein domain-containing protein-containing protein [Benjaminiella poitrasii]
MIRATSVLMIVAALLAFFAVTQAAVIEARDSSHSGHATYYSVKKSGKPSCGKKYDNDDLVVALSDKRMPKGHGKPCGKKIKVKGPKGSVKVKVVDTCPECSKNDIDLSPKAFEKIAKKKDGRVKVTWSYD